MINRRQPSHYASAQFVAKFLPQIENLVFNQDVPVLEAIHHVSVMNSVDIVAFAVLVKGKLRARLISELGDKALSKNRSVLNNNKKKAEAK